MDDSGLFIDFRGMDGVFLSCVSHWDCGVAPASDGTGDRRRHVLACSVYFCILAAVSKQRGRSAHIRFYRSGVWILGVSVGRGTARRSGAPRWLAHRGVDFGKTVCNCTFLLSGDCSGMYACDTMVTRFHLGYLSMVSFSSKNAKGMRTMRMYTISDRMCRR